MDAKLHPCSTATGTIEISDKTKLAKNPLVSIYMLTYNHERYIGDAIASVVSQHCDFPFELIVGEDCSRDSTGEIVRSWQAKHPELIRVLTAERNVGGHANAARCRAAIRGQFMAICEGDDYWQNPNKLQMQVAAMSASPDVTLCHTEFDRRIGFRIKHNRHASLGRSHPTTGDVYADLLREWTVMTASAMYRMDVVREFLRSGFYETRWPFGDYNLALYASLKGKVAYLPVSTATWRRVGGSASNSGPEKALAMHLAAIECRRRYMRAYPIPPAQEHAVECAIHAKTLPLSFAANRPDLYRESLEWLQRHGEATSAFPHLVKLAAMRLQLPVTAINTGRRILRAIAEFEP
jgi:hypothetical protein